MGERDDPPAGERPRREQRTTFRGYGPPAGEPAETGGEGRFEEEATEVADEPRVRRRRRRGRPAIDIDLIHERRTAPLPDRRWVFVEVWTRNTIYALDSRLVCIEVVDQVSRKSDPEHALLGARLVGGQRKGGEAMELSHPFPRPGSEAVFEQSAGKQARFSQTSTVTRVVLRLRVLSVATEQTVPAWEEITGSHEVQGLLGDGG